ncbi:snoRNA-binding rRNA-processing protein utp10 [Ophidiomyces ophidiicola]|uniref:SnoRNA-binding rRNA-processing protein utp10 n=1 Tax=Ophidiomyces ophidiicola TaxID=1387563 RepID=A0ACB8V4H1_9EURO|nr:snoRNA-binding rRNA-processing protein utp10 [Ophidiomyces ophidiicola]KAI1914058.1 snoRNA-binding rRNA-processing protein utp10 [Ophidiomyces ophidiicola]KAI1929560.1 snoRNA-binding rRNA-processing protein utp10 [Ophidiomyces ophidiicola]KAI1943414.1 snoRNA-binding rRNA-processing protein utp10 [Ophidiomyces ophidiicola]KAI1968438.1 snoRNA-binding rRNA-processing protein utp10 [Ophidiomyces ophidiicola]
MASSLAAQLAQIAATSTHQLDLKAQRAAHSQSLIFDKKVAGSQDFDTIFQICYEGFQELCSLDARFLPFRRTIFSDHSKTEDRGQMTADQNKKLDNVLEDFMILVGARLLLNPAVKAIDWLIRRFRVHEHNTPCLLLTFLPYHTTPLFLNLLSILPDDLTQTFKVLFPYKRSLSLPPRQAIVQSATTNKLFFSALNNYVLQAGRNLAQYQGLVSFWAGVTTEALANMLDSAKSGRMEIENRNKEDVLIRILPVLNDAFMLQNAPQLVVGCYMFCVVLASKADLEDHVLDDLMEAVTSSWTETNTASGITCLSVLAQHKQEQALSQKVVKALMGVDNVIQIIEELSGRYSMTNLILGLLKGCVQWNGKRADSARIPFVGQVIEKSILNDEETVKALVILLEAIDSLQRRNLVADGIGKQLSDLLLQFNESAHLTPLLRSAVQESGVDVTQLEMTLETVLHMDVTPMEIEYVDMADSTGNSEIEDTFAKAFESLSKVSPKEYSFLVEQPNLFNQLAHAFVHGAFVKDRVSKFIKLPVLHFDKALEDPLYLSFFIRFFCGPYPATARAVAISIITSCVAEMADNGVDIQAIIPYTISALADPSERVRREAAGLLTIIDRQISKCRNKDTSDICIWGREHVYGQTDFSKSIQWLSAKDVYKLTHRVLIPGVEEFILDPDQVGRTLVLAIRGEVAGSKTVDAELKKQFRRDLFSFICSHVNSTPLHTVKLRLLKILNQVGKVGSMTRTQTLRPIFDHWRLLRPDDIQRIENEEQIPVKELEEQILRIIYPKDTDAVELLYASIVSNPQTTRPSFQSAAFNRLREAWRSFDPSYELVLASKLLELCLEPEPENIALVSGAKGLLRAVDLSGPVILDFVGKVSSSGADLGYRGPPSKKRRTSQNNMVSMNLMDKEMAFALQKITFVLELVDGSHPENSPELIPGLFQILTTIHHLKLQTRSEMSYLLSLNLGILLSIINKWKGTPARKINSSSLRADLIIDCVRTSESPQVQNTALLLVAGLATVAPELVLHSVMPIFTFMGSSVLRKDDEYSALVIDQTIDQVVPPLVQSLRNQKRDVVSGTSELLLSFTTAFEHIPSYRRLRLFDALVAKLGPEDFLFAVFAMFANRYALDKDVLSVMTALASDCNVELQLITYGRYLNLVKDALQPKPKLAKTLLGVGGEDGRDPQRVAVDLLQALSHLLKFASLRTKITECFDSGTDEQIDKAHTLFSSLLEQVIALSEPSTSTKSISNACGETLGTLLGTLSLVDFIDTVEVLLRRPSNDLRRKVLKLLENRLDDSEYKDRPSQLRTLSFLTVLIDILETSPDTLLQHTAIACIEKISEKYGKKEPQQVVSAAKVISGTHGIGQPEKRIRVMGLLCLASMTDVVGEAIIPALPDGLPRAFDLLKNAVETSTPDSELHDAVFSFISAILIQIPWIISGSHLDKILQLSAKCSNADLNQGCEENRIEVLQLLASKSDVGEVLAAIERNWDLLMPEGPKVIQEVLDIAKIAIEKHPKSATVKNIPVLMKLLCKAFDLRRIRLLSGDSEIFDEIDVTETESQINDVAIKMIYKLNDTTFHPLFIDLADWAMNGLNKKEHTGRIARLTSFYSFLQCFFGTLKSIVTGYSSYVIENAVEVLKISRCNDKATKPLWLACLSMLRNSFEHDQDEFWQSPSHLASISEPLLRQISLAQNASTSNLVVSEAIPTIVALAVAADSSENHKELNTTIMKYLRAGPSSRGNNAYTRLAAVKCEHQLTERLGEEWLAMLPEMLPYISELLEDDDENVEREARKWVLTIEDILGEKLDDMLA